MKWWNSPLPYALLFVVLILGLVASCTVAANNCVSHGGSWDGDFLDCTNPQ